MDAARAYWTRYLQGLCHCLFPSCGKYQQKADSHECRGSVDIQLPCQPEIHRFCAYHGVNLINLVQLAWGLVLRTYTGAESISFAYHEDEAWYIYYMDIPGNATLRDLLKQSLDIVTNHRAYKAAYSTTRLLDLAGIAGDRPFNSSLTLHTGVRDCTMELSGMEAINMEVTDVQATGDGEISALLNFSRDILSDEQALHISHLVGHIMNEIISQADDTVDNLVLLSKYDYESLVTWNSRIPERVEACVHHWIKDRCESQPDKLAVLSWDGQLSYSELHMLSSQLAVFLAAAGVTPGATVPLCFEKSKWAIVAVLGVIKAGGAFVFLDPSHPVKRMREIVDDAGGWLLLSSPAQEERVTPLASKILTVSAVEAYWTDSHEGWSARGVIPSHPLYVVFTSGSTGRAKGVLVDHGAFCTKAEAAGPALRLDTKPKVLQFTSYSFDVSYRDILTTLIWGGCLCVPSENERLNDLAGFMQRSGVTWASLTPSVAGLLSPELVPELQYLVVAGEQMPPKIQNIWVDKVELINAYGPCECIGISSWNTVLPHTNCANIGKGLAAALWLVDPQDAQKLVPVGCVGEIVIEGQAMGQGYLNNEDQTRKSYVGSLDWQPSARPRRRLYKTGDLGRLDARDNTVIFCGRKDSRIKLFGQLIELEEVEFHVHRCLAALDSKEYPGIAALLINTTQVVVCVDMSAVSQISEDQCASGWIAPASATPASWEKLPDKLAEVVPRYMIPAMFLPLRCMPLTTSGKKDRRLLNGVVSQFMEKRLQTYIHGERNMCQDRDTADAAEQPASLEEQTLRLLWADLLGLKATDIRLTDSFFRLGGNSLAAIALVHRARERGVALSVETILRNPGFLAQVDILKGVNHSSSQGSPGRLVTDSPFSLVDVDSNELEEIMCCALEKCHLPKATIEDIYPCTPMQEGLIARTERFPGANLMQHVYAIREDVDVARFLAAWNAVVAQNPILRTRIVRCKSAGTLQVVTTHEAIEWQRHSDLEEYLLHDRSQSMGPGDALTRFTLIEYPVQQQRLLVTTMHHVLFDGWSRTLMLKQAEASYLGLPMEQVPITPFVRFTADMMPDAERYWRQELDAFTGPQFPSLPSCDYIPVASATETVTFSSLPMVASDFTASTWVQLAWSLSICHYTSSPDTVFGSVLTGRGIPVCNIERMIVPAFTTIPVRIHLGPAATVKDMLHCLLNKSATRIPYEHIGLQNLSALSDAADNACRFQSLLIFEPGGEDMQFRSGIMKEAEEPVGNYFAATSYALVLLITQKDRQTLDIRVNFDPMVMNPSQIKIIIRYFGTSLRWIIQHEEAPVSTVPFANETPR